MTCSEVAVNTGLTVYRLNKNYLHFYYYLVTLFDPSQFGDTLCVFHFQKKISIKKKTASLFGDTFFGDTFFGDTFASSPASKNRFRNI